MHDTTWRVPLREIRDHKLVRGKDYTHSQAFPFISTLATNMREVVFFVMLFLIVAGCLVKDINSCFFLDSNSVTGLVGPGREAANLCLVVVEYTNLRELEGLFVFLDLLNYFMRHILNVLFYLS